MKEKLFLQMLQTANQAKKRLVAPLVGFPGLKLINSTIKIAQQNYYEHFRLVKAISETFNPDVVFPLMDLSVEANALGKYTVFPVDESPTVIAENFIESDLRKIKEINIKYDSRLISYVKTVELMSFNLPRNILIGAYVTGPYTLAGLLLGASNAATLSITEPEYLNEICEIVIEKILDYVRLLISAGAQIICVLEPSAVMLGPEQFEMFSKNYVKKIVDICNDTNVSTVYHICGNSMHLIEKMCEAGVNALSLDSKEAGVNLEEVFKKIPCEIAVIGNINPTGKILTGTPRDVEEEVNNLLIQMNSYSNFILSTGCDLPKEVPIENIKAFIQAGRNYKIN
ncbi:MAG: uroporphyrinogen decarboxylase family protein [Melioribacter sp.]|nr:uroporphyrinogen decarboxylase family protein [Melioribacter sp.]